MESTFSRRDFLKVCRTITLGLAISPIISASSPTGGGPLETELLRDFLTTTPQLGIYRTGIEHLLYNIRMEGGIQSSTRGRSIHIGDGYFLTAYHVVDPKKVGRGQSLKLLPQSRGRLSDFAQGFKIVHYDEESDLALLKIPVERMEGKANVHLALNSPNLDEVVSVFYALSEEPRQTPYEFDLLGKNYYDERDIMRLGKLVLPANSSLFEKQGKILPYDKYLFMKKFGINPIPTGGSFSSITGFDRDSGSPVFLKYPNDKYVFIGIVTAAWPMWHQIGTPGNPLGFKWIYQHGTLFPNRYPIKSLIRNYNPAIIKSRG